MPRGFPVVVRLVIHNSRIPGRLVPHCVSPQSVAVGDVVMLQDQTMVPYELRKQRFFLVKEVPEGTVTLCPRELDPTRAVLLPCDDLGVVGDGAQPVGVPLSHVFGKIVFPAAMGAQERKQRLLDFLLHDYSRDHACEVRCARCCCPSCRLPWGSLPNKGLCVVRAAFPLCALLSGSLPNNWLCARGSPLSGQENYNEARQAFLLLITSRLPTNTNEGAVLSVRGPFSRTVFLSAVRAKFVHWQDDKRWAGKWAVWDCPPSRKGFGKRVLRHMLQSKELPTKTRKGIKVGLGDVLDVAYNDCTHMMRVRFRVTIL